MISGRNIYFGQKLSRFLSVKTNKFVIVLLLAWVIIALFADILATDQPLYIKYKGNSWFPAFSALYDSDRIESFKLAPEDKTYSTLDFANTDWKQLESEVVIWALIPWHKDKPDVYNRDFVGPFDTQKIKSIDGNMQVSPWRFRHFLGTDRLGRDLMAMLIHGSRISLKIGLFSALLASFIGLILGGISGYYGDDKFNLKRIQYIMGLLGLSFGLFWAFISRNSNIVGSFSEGIFSSFIQLGLSIIIIFATAYVFIIISGLIKAGKWLQQERSIAIDSIIQRFIELFSTMPKILILLTLAAVLKDKSIEMVIAIIGLTSWTGISRYCRAELLRIRTQPYIEAAQMQGMKSLEILFKHALPNAMGPVVIEIAFLISGSILAESSLSFLGIGVPVEISTWGSILSEGRQDFDAWWMVVFPGLAIFITILLFNSLGQRLRTLEKI